MRYKHPHRTYAHPFDTRVYDGNESVHGVSPSSDAIGGHYGIGWTEVYRDHITGEIFSVHCSDGVYGGKDSYSDSHLMWMEEQRRMLWDRVAEGGKVSNNEAAVLKHFCDPPVGKIEIDASLPDQFTRECP